MQKFTTTLRHLMDMNTKTKSILSVAGSHVNHTALLENVKRLVTSVTYGVRSSESYANRNQNSFWVKTSEGYCLPSLEHFSGEYSMTWMNWGIAWDGVCTELRTSELSTEGNGFLSLPTPVASEGRQRAIIGKGDHFVANENSVTRVDARGVEWMAGIMQTVLVRQMLPTPKASDGTMGAIIGEKDVFVQGPTGSYTKTAKSGETGGVSLPVTLMLNMKISGEEIGGTGTSNQSSMKPKLNPEFVERMMGFPTGWTDLKHSETL
jgi:hypothetical protein